MPLFEQALGRGAARVGPRSDRRWGYTDLDLTDEGHAAAVFSGYRGVQIDEV